MTQDKQSKHKRCENKNNRVKVSMVHSIHLVLILQYITSTFYYIIKETFR